MRLVNRVTSLVCANYFPKCERCAVKAYCKDIVYDSSDSGKVDELLKKLDDEALKVHNKSKGTIK